MPVLSRQIGAVQPEQIQGDSTWGEAFGASAKEAWETGPTGSLNTWARLRASEDGKVPEILWASGIGIGAGINALSDVQDTPSPKLSPADATQRVKDAGLEGQIPLSKYPEGIRTSTLNILIEKNRAKQSRQTVMSEYDGWTPGISGMLAGSLIDPANVALSFIPVVGEARYAKLLASAGEGAFARAGVRAGVGAAEGAVGAAIVEPAIYAGQQQWRNDYTAMDSMLNIAGGAVFGGLLHAGAGLARDKFGNPEFNTMRDGVPVKDAPPAEAAATPENQRVFHGSRRNDIERIALDRSGTGSGEANYGFGAYFAGSREGADAIRSSTSSISRVPGGKLADDALTAVGGDRVRAAENLRRQRSRAPEGSRADFDRALDVLRREPNRGTTYAADIPSDNQLLAWDQPLSAQSPQVQEALGRLGYSDPEQAGSAIYRDLTAKQGSQQAASDLLLKEGIPGNRYNDGRGGQHYVVWDEGRIGGLKNADLETPKNDVFASVRPLIASLDEATQGAALRNAIAQAVDGRPVDVTPAMLADPVMAADPEAFRTATQRAMANASQVEGASIKASTAAEARVSEAKPADLEAAKQRLAEDEELLRDKGGDPSQIDLADDDLKLTTDAVKAATLCMMRTGG